jgi:YgiT-type zinc finger domain-containing protein
MDKLAKEKMMKLTKPFDKCPVCGGELEEKEVEKLLRGGVNTAIIRVRAEVCLHCGERLYSQETVRLFEEIRRKLERKEVANFQPIGQSFKVTG